MRPGTRPLHLSRNHAGRQRAASPRVEGFRLVSGEAGETCDETFHHAQMDAMASNSDSHGKARRMTLIRFWRIERGVPSARGR